MSTREQRFFQQGCNDYHTYRQPRWGKTHPHYNSYISGWNVAAKAHKDSQPTRWERLKAKVKAWIGK